MEVICPSAIDSLVQIWTVLHKDLELEIDHAEKCYLRAVAFGLDDELIARLLAVKLAIAGTGKDSLGSQDVARRGRDILFSVQGRRRDARLVHGNAEGSGLLGCATRFGCALVGLREGASLLWPSEHGRLVEVQALSVRAANGDRAAPRGNPIQVVRNACAYG